MNALISLISAIGSVISALRYEVARLRGSRAMRGVVLSSLVGSLLLTLPAARHMVGLVHPVPPLPRSLHPGHAYAGHAYLEYAYPPGHGGGAWVVAGGVVGMVLPGAAAALGAAWFGATCIGYEYWYRGGLLAFALVPRRGSVLLAKAIVAAGFGALLCLATTAAAYGTAWLGFRATGLHVALPSALLVPVPRAAAMAALGGALGVFGGAVLRLRTIATVSALSVCALVAAFLPRSSSLAVPYLAEAARYVVRMVPGVTYAVVLDSLLALPLAVLVLAGLVAVRRRRVV